MAYQDPTRRLLQIASTNSPNCGYLVAKGGLCHRVADQSGGGLGVGGRYRNPPLPRSNTGAGLPQPPYPQPPAAAHPQPACGLRAWPTMGDACMSPGAKLEAGLGRVESVEAQGLLPPDAAAKARDALVAEYTKSLFTAGNASGGGGGGVSNATVGARAAPPAHTACDAEDQCAAETLSSIPKPKQHLVPHKGISLPSNWSSCWD